MERRLARDGINDIRQLCERRPRDAGDAWGGVNGDRLWYLLHGVDLPEKPTQSRTIGHSHVLSPSKRGHGAVAADRAPPGAEGRQPAAAQGLSRRLLVLHGKFEDDKIELAHLGQAARDAGQLRRARPRSTALFPRLARGRARARPAAFACG